MVCTVSVVVFNVLYCMHGLTSIAVVMISLLHMHTYVPLHPHMHTIHPLTHIIHTHNTHTHYTHTQYTCTLYTHREIRRREWIKSRIRQRWVNYPLLLFTYLFLLFFSSPFSSPLSSPPIIPIHFVSIYSSKECLDEPTLSKYQMNQIPEEDEGSSER